MDVDAIRQVTDTERASLADLVEPLTPEQWSTPSLCDRWTVGDVAAHLTLAHMGWVSATVEAARAFGSFNRMIHDTAVRANGLEPAVYAERLRAMVGSRRRAPVVSPVEPMLDAFQRAASARDQVATFETEILPRMLEVERIAQEGYAAGQTGLPQLVTALQQGRDIRRRSLESALAYQRAFAELERAMGVPLR